MNPVVVRNVKIGEGIPKICVPIVGVTREEILAAGARIREIGADVAEWLLRQTLGDLPLLFTFRTSKEGGEKAMETEAYVRLNQEMAESGSVDLVDAELFTGDEEVRQIVKTAHQCGAKVIVSNHDFHKTPDKEELLKRLCKMQELGADIPKIAVMPQNKKDVLTLLAATEEMTSVYADRPVITMSMAGTGVLSRLCGEVFGSALTFGAAGKASAPGQMAVEDLKTALELLHKSL